MAENPTEKKIKITIIGIVDEIPEVGGVFGTIIELLWPEHSETEDPWEQIRERTEGLINQKLDEATSNRLESQLNGLRNVSNDFVTAVKNKDLPPIDLYARWTATQTVFEAAIPMFQEKEHELLLLPLFVQAANLYLGLLRYAAKYGDHMEMPKSESASWKSRLKQLTQPSSEKSPSEKSYPEYIDSIFIERKGHKLAELDQRSNFVAQMTLDVADYVKLWPAFDPDAGPFKTFPLDREIFSSVYGPGDMGPPQNPPQKGYFPPPKPRTRVTGVKVYDKGLPVWESIEVWNDGIISRRMGGDYTGVNSSVLWALDLQPLGTLTEIRIGTTDGGICALEFVLEDGSVQGHHPERFNSWRIKVPAGHYLSSLNVGSHLSDSPRGELYNDLVRSMWVGMCIDEKEWSWSPPN